MAEFFQKLREVWLRSGDFDVSKENRVINFKLITRNLNRYFLLPIKLAAQNILNDDYSSRGLEY